MASSDKAQEKRMDQLQKYVSDMIALEDHIESAVSHQTKDDKLEKHNAEAVRIIYRIEQLNKSHREALRQHLEALGGDTASGLKEMASDLLGNIAGLYDKVRTQAVSKMLRDDYTALNLAAMGYTMLHTTALALNDQRTADLALRHLRDYAGTVMSINEIIPQVVVDDLRNDVEMINEASVHQALQNSQSAWRSSGEDHKSDQSSSKSSMGSSSTMGTSSTGVAGSGISGGSSGRSGGMGQSGTQSGRPQTGSGTTF
jgi:hypothetical protein